MSQTTFGKCPDTGWRIDYVQEVLGWRWMANCGGTAHWQTLEGSCRAAVPSWLEELGYRNAKILIDHFRAKGVKCDS